MDNDFSSLLLDARAKPSDRSAAVGAACPTMALNHDKTIAAELSAVQRYTSKKRSGVGARAGRF